MANGFPKDPFDAVLLVSFGGPEGSDDVLPFLKNVTRGRDIPDERLYEVGQHYFHFDGVSPINGQNRQFLAALRAELPAHGIHLPVYWGNRNWDPFLVDTLRTMRADGKRCALAFFTSAYSSYSGCRQYRENIAAALTDVGEGVPVVERLGPYFNHSGFVGPFVDATSDAVRGLSESDRSAARLVFTTHSIPQSMADGSGPATGLPGGAYVQQHRWVAGFVSAQVAAATGIDLPWDLVYQSRSGAPHIPWLEPDIDTHLRDLARDGCTAAVVVPIGFVSDHMEVLWDLDTQARATAAEVGLPMVRVATPGVDPRMVAMVGELIRERLDAVPVEGRARLGDLGASPNRCASGCCPNPRVPIPAVAGDSDSVP
ncbi:MAG: ferrochelatase [Actinomycetia bacterium]|nr:ferrochelatase [Actinomycetes bacterium]